jgi:hypothetical protein
VPRVASQEKLSELWGMIIAADRVLPTKGKWASPVTELDSALIQILLPIRFEEQYMSLSGELWVF